jgi:RNA polymerase sigma-70 factor (ECF subfamily)
MASHWRPDSAAIAESIAEPVAFGIVFDRHFDRVHGYLQRQVGPDMADDLAAQTFLVAFDRRTRFDLSHLSARPWLFGIAANLAREHFREVRRRLAAYSRRAGDLASDAFEGIEDRIDASALRGPLATAIAEVPREELETLLLHAWAELTYAEIAEALAVPVGTVRSRLNRVRGRLRSALEGLPVAAEAGGPGA